MLEILSELPISKETIATFDDILIVVKHLLALFGSLVILFGSLFVICQFVYRFIYRPQQRLLNFDLARLGLTRSIVFGLEFIIAGDVIQTTATPDYYVVGILGAVVLIRAFLNYSLNKDLTALSQREQAEREQLAKAYQEK